MSADLVILVPVLNRPHRVAPLLDSIEASTPQACVYFLSQLYDNEENRAIWAECDERDSDDGLQIHLNLEGGTYAEKINRATRHPTVEQPLIFLGADDLEFQPGWFEAAKAAMRDGVEVVGVNDLIRRRRNRQGHATHFLVSRPYAEQRTIDGDPGLLHEGYDHSFVDDEFIATAEKRGVYAYAPAAHVRHVHWMNRSAPDDETYRKGRAKFEQDRQLFHERSALWA